jgi:hypothetical protein
MYFRVFEKLNIFLELRTFYGKHCKTKKLREIHLERDNVPNLLDSKVLCEQQASFGPKLPPF